MNIPKIIWQTHEWEYEDLPINFKRSSHTWKNLNLEWKYIYHSSIDRANMVKDFDRELYQYYMFADKVTQSDIWRYIAIYQYGGVYVDMDSYCISPLNSLLSINNLSNKEMICSEIEKHAILNDKTQNINIFRAVNNAGFAAIKESQIIKKILDNIKNKYNQIGTALSIYNNIEEQSGIEFRVSSKDLWLGSPTFSSVALNHEDLISFNFSCMIHSKDLKSDFSGSFTVDYYGILKDYSSLCKENHWNEY
jgi:hypothetical protein